MDHSECMKSQELMLRLNQLPTQMLSLEQFLYSKFRNVGVVFLQTSLGLAITLSNPGDGEQSGIEIPSILQVMYILTSDSKKFSILKKGIGIEGEKITETS